MVRSHLNYSFDYRKYLEVLNSNVGVEDLTSLISQFLRIDRGELFSKGRYALYEALRRLNLPKGSLIAVQPLNCNTVFDAIKEAGYQTLFVDINEQFSIDAKSLDSKKKVIAAVILTHTYGLPADINSIKEIIGNIPVIEDCAHSFLSKYGEGMTGSFFNQSIFSFGYSKFPNTPGLGYLVSNGVSEINNLPQARIMRSSTMKIFLRSNLFKLLNSRFVYALITSKIKNRMKFSPLSNSESWSSGQDLDQMQVNYLESILSDILAMRDKQRLNASHFSEVANIDYCNRYVESVEWNGFMFPLRVKGAQSLIDMASSLSIPVGRHFVKSASWIKEYGYRSGECPNYEKVVENLVTFPTHYALSENDVKNISTFIKNKVKIDDSRL